jgi:formate hydrogenlyase subunit 3/multisubunit Na+/H+ antiporter MnhD subunit
MEGRLRRREYFAYLLWTIGLACGAVLANDLILLLVFWGLLGLTLYVMVGMGDVESSAAAKKTFIIIGGSDCLMILGVGIVWLLAHTTQISTVKLPLGTKLANAGFLCLVIAAFAKAGAMPFHTWVPDCGEHALIPVSAFLPASLDKLLGIYLLARVCGGMFQMTPTMNTLLMFLGAITIICAVMMAMIQHDLKRLLAYHAVSQVGYMVLGIGSGTVVGIAGALFHMLNNAIYKSALFLSAGAVEKQTGTTDLDKLGGLGKVMPLTLASCFVSAMAISGIPPLNGFVSKWMVYQGIIESGKSGGSLWILWLVFAMVGSALTLASFVKVLHAVFFRKASPDVAKKDINEVPFPMWFPMVILAGLCVLFGILASRLPLAYFIHPSVKQITGQTLSFSGLWLGGTATLMMIIAFIIGIIFYIITSVRNVRLCPTYIGGEIMDEVYISGVPHDQTRDVEVTGVDFYRTIQEIPIFGFIYMLAEKKFFDIYEIGRKIAFGVGAVFSFMHSGNLQTYLAWCLLGFVIILLVWLL